MLADKRYEYILRQTERKGFVRTSLLAHELHVSETTVRRDIEELDRQNRLIRVHGGAKSLAKQYIVSPTEEPRMQDRHTLHAREKELICAQAAQLVKDGDSVFVDGGTTLVPLMGYLNRMRVKIVTHSLLAAQAFDSDTAELFMLPGTFDPFYAMSTGPATEEMLEKFHFSIAFLGCLGIDAMSQEVYTAEMDTPSVKRVAARQSEKTVLLADSSKLDVTGYYTMCHTSSVDMVIMDDGVCRLGEENIPENVLIATESVSHQND